MLNIFYIILILVFLHSCSFTSYNDTIKANKIVNEGIPYLKKGDISGALKRFDKALELDENNLVAQICRTECLYLLKKYDEAILNCQSMIKKYRDSTFLQKIYLIKGLALKDQRKIIEAQLNFNEANKIFPINSNFNYHLGMIAKDQDSNEKAISYFEESLLCKWQNEDASFELTKILNKKGNIMPIYFTAILGIINSPNTKDSDTCFSILIDLIKAMSDTNNKSIEILKKESLNNFENFVNIEFVLRQSIQEDDNKNYYKLNEVGSFAKYLTTTIQAIKKSKSNNDNFYWKYCANYFIALLDNNYVETVSYIVYRGNEDEIAKEWFENNYEKISEFYKWHQNYEIVR